MNTIQVCMKKISTSMHKHVPRRQRALPPRRTSAYAVATWLSIAGEDGAYLLRIASGRPLPRGATVHGVVTSDASCEPDAQGFSHCRNGIDLAGGVRLVVDDTHQMSRHPCLTPGEDVRITGFNDQWAALKLNGAPRET